MKLLHRLMIAFGLLLLIVTGASAYLIDSMLLDNLIDQQRKELKLKGEFWAEKVSSSSQTEEEMIEELNQLVMSNKKVEILLLGKQKKVMYTTIQANSLKDWMQTLERRAEKKQDKKLWLVGEAEYIVVSQAVKAGENQRLLLATPVRGIKDVRYEITTNIMIILFIGVICAILLSFFITSSLVKPLSSLMTELKKVRERHFSEVKHIHASGEIGTVTQSVYFLAQELERFQEVQRQFFQNASHELKTPLMSIQGYAEGIRDGIFTGEAASQGLDVIVE
ncbi:histidine kinase dimerization/phospho-acceptor domain-containing protein [Brevibacillus panacihumi]|uniref:histidine kinase dimerization/phospho-acceptor domain-containing protein n=1 Tax=Brevibacillus panacihumi TaxID=497735 RepID=UPI003D023D15